MDTDQRIHCRWLLTGLITGLAANLLYIAVSVALDAPQPPVRVLYPLAWLFGPLVMVTAPAISAYLAPRGSSITVDLGRRCMMAAGLIVTLAIVLRGLAEERALPTRPESPAYAARFADDALQNALMSVQRGTELTWETFIYLATFLFGAAMLRQGRARATVGALGVVIALLGLGVNAAAWPADPDAVGLFAAGPFVGFWFIALALMMGWRYRRLTRDDA